MGKASKMMKFFSPCLFFFLCVFEPEIISSLVLVLVHKGEEEEKTTPKNNGWPDYTELDT